MTDDVEKPKSKRGFASMDPEKRRKICSLGGKAAHAKGTAHKWTTEEAREAGRLGGQKVAEDQGHMSAIGRLGGLNRHPKKKEPEEEKTDAALSQV